MFDSSWNSAAFQRFAGQVGILQNGHGKWLLFDTESGQSFPNAPLFESREAAEEARKQIYDNWVNR